MSNTNNPSAFPSTNHGMIVSTGMSLRDYFATKAMTGLLANNDLGWGIDEYVRYAYKVADAMLKAREV